VDGRQDAKNPPLFGWLPRYLQGRFILRAPGTFEFDEIAQFFMLNRHWNLSNCANAPLLAVHNIEPCLPGPPSIVLCQSHPLWPSASQPSGHCRLFRLDQVDSPEAGLLDSRSRLANRHLLRKQGHSWEAPVSLSVQDRSKSRFRYVPLSRHSYVVAKDNRFVQ